MENYIGVKNIKAEPMTRLEYNFYRGWVLPKDENGSDEGYLVEYINGGESNHIDHKGYISWSPKAVFEKAYKNIEETLGAERTSYKFNPSGFGSVDELKSLGAYLINKVETFRNDDNAREVELAQTKIEEGIMFAVKAIFK